MTNYIEFAFHVLTLADGRQFATKCHEHSEWLHRKLAPDQAADSERWLSGLSDRARSIHPANGRWFEDNRLGTFSSQASD